MTTTIESIEAGWLKIRACIQGASDAQLKDAKRIYFAAAGHMYEVYCAVLNEMLNIEDENAAEDYFAAELMKIRNELAAYQMTMELNATHEKSQDTTDD